MIDFISNNEQLRSRRDRVTEKEKIIPFLMGFCDAFNAGGTMTI